MRQREFSYTLPVGYTDASVCHQEVTLRKMTGHEELLMADPNINNNGGRLISALLRNCLVKLGSFSNVTHEHLANMATVDRNFLLVKLRSITFGNTLTSSYICDYCEKAVYFEHDLDNLPLKNVENFCGEIIVDLKDGYFDKNTNEVYTEMVLRPPIGKDEEATALLMAQQGPIGARNSIFTRCLKRLGTLPQEKMQGLGSGLFLDLTIPDIRLIEEQFDEQLPGLELSEEIICPTCHGTFRGQIKLGNFLLPM